MTTGRRPRPAGGFANARTKLLAGALLAAVSLAAAAVAAATTAAAPLAPGTQFTQTYMKYTTQAFSQVARAADGSTYVLGECASSRGDSDLLLVKLRPDGSVAWGRPYDTPTHRDEHPCALSVSSSGLVAVGANASQAPVNNRALVVAWSPTGKVLWSRQLRPADGGSSFASDLVTDRYGRVFVAGQASNAARGTDFMVAAYGKDGAPLWTRMLDGGVKGGDAAWALAADGRGNLYAAGEMARAATGMDAALAKYSPSGRRLWLRTWDNGAAAPQRLADVAVRGTVVAVAGVSADIGIGRGLVGRYDTAGRRRWVWVDPSVGRQSTYQAIAIDGYSHLVAAGYEDFNSGRSVDFLVTRFEPSGGPPIWDYRLYGPGEVADYAQAVAVSAEGEIYAAGSVQNADATSDAVLVRLGPLATERWVARYSAGAEEGFAGLELDGKGVTGVGSISDFGLVQRYTLTTAP